VVIVVKMAVSIVRMAITKKRDSLRMIRSDFVLFLFQNYFSNRNLIAKGDITFSVGKESVLKPGIYFVNIQYNGRIITKKLILINIIYIFEELKRTHLLF
jgi:hypothetical protein